METLFQNDSGVHFLQRVRLILISPHVLDTEFFLMFIVFNADKLMELCCRFLSKSVKLEDVSSLPLPDFIKTEIERHYNSP